MTEETPSVKDSCSEGEHRIVRNDDGFKICEKCGLAIHSIQDWLGHEVTDEEIVNS